MPLFVRRCLLLGACALSFACGGEDGPSGPPTVVLGSGELEFEVLDDGDTIEVIQGPQGGFHLLGSVRASGLRPGNPDDINDPKNPTTTFEVYRSGGERLDGGASSYVQGLDRAGDGVYEMTGRFVILAIASDDEVDGAEITMSVSVIDHRGEMATDSRELMVVPSPLNP